MTRTMKPSKGYFTGSGEAAAEVVGTIEGASLQGLLTAKTLMVGENVLVLEIFREKGLIDNRHVHDDHETVGYLLKGKLKMEIGDQVFIAEPGATWIHYPGVEHQSEALEDCIQLEIKSPPKKTWNE